MGSLRLARSLGGVGMGAQISKFFKMSKFDSKSATILNFSVFGSATTYGRSWALANSSGEMAGRLEDYETLSE